MPIVPRNAEKCNRNSFEIQTLLLGVGLEEQRGERAEEHGGGDARGGGGQAAGEGADDTDLLYGFLHAVGERMAKAGQRDGRAGAGEIYQGAVDPHGAEDHPQHDVPHQDARGGQLGLEHQEFADDADRAAHGEGFQ